MIIPIHLEYIRLKKWTGHIAKKVPLTAIFGCGNYYGKFFPGTVVLAHKCVESKYD